MAVNSFIGNSAYRLGTPNDPSLKIWKLQLTPQTAEIRVGGSTVDAPGIAEAR
jgi:hypothetical protein